MSTSTSDPDRSHRRAQRALAERAAGLLAAAEETWLDEHLSACDSCRSSAEALEERMSLPGVAGHLPVGLVSRWGTEFAKTPETVRKLVVSHLHGCAQCRAELRMLGHQLPAGVEGSLSSDGREPARPLLDRLLTWMRRSPGGGWMMGGLTAAAALLATFGPVAVRYLSSRGAPGFANNDIAPGDSTTSRVDSLAIRVPQGPMAARDTVTPSPAPARPSSPSTEPQLALAGAGDPEPLSFESISLDQTMLRGAAQVDSGEEFSVRDGTHVLRADHPLGAFLAADGVQRVTISITTPSGLTLQQKLRARDLLKDRPLRLVMPKGVELGVYHFTYLFQGGARDKKIEGQFRILQR